MRIIDTYKVIKNQFIISALLSIMVFLFTSVTSIWVWWRYQNDVIDEQVQNINTLGEHTRSRIWSSINTDIDQLKNFSNRLEFTKGEFFKYWQQDAEQLIRLDSSILFIEWIDSNMVIQDVVPMKPNRDIFRLDVSKVSYRVDGWRKAARSHKLNVTPWSNLIQGGNAFLIDSPVWIRGEFLGTLTGGFDFSHDINQFFEENENYHIHLYDHHNVQFYCSSPLLCEGIEVDEKYKFEGLINVDNNADIWWKMEFYPSGGVVTREARINSLISLSLSLFLGLTLSIALYFILKTNRQEKTTQAINERLETLNVTLENEKRRAEEASRVKSEFLSNMSHEIRTPLNIIQGLIQLLSETDDPKRRYEYVELLKNSTSNLLGLLNNILDIDRIEAGLMSIQNERFQPVKKLLALCEIFRQGFSQKGVELRFETTEDEDVWLVGDEVKFSQIVSNFIQNALKFTTEGHVSLFYEHYSQQGDSVEILLRIQDTGIGIPANRLSQIFERFSQIDSGFKKKYSGTGLGLSINYELVRLLGGDIVVTSEEGVGTEFVVTLTFTYDKRSKDASLPEKPVLVTDFKGQRCLIVEDNELNVLVLSKMVESLGFKWHAESDGAQGVEAFKKDKYDLVIMDLHMPVMDGMTASRLIMEVDPSMPILMLSANVTKEAIEQSREIGIHHYLTKPVSKEKFIEVINRLLIKY